MTQSKTNQRKPTWRRAGMAPLEFVMALPVLLLLMVGITWLGFTVIGQTEVLIEARNKTWKRRFENASKKPLYFPLLKGLYNQKSDFVIEKVTQKINVSPIFNAVPGPAAGHMILAGAWDHQAMDFKNPPDLKLMAVAAGIGLFGTALDVGASLDDPLGLLQEAGNFFNSGKDTQSKNSAGMGNVGQGGEAGSGSGSPPGGIPGEPQSTDQGKAKTEAERKAEKDKLIKRRDELGGQFIYRPLQTEPEVFPVGGLLKKNADEYDRLTEQWFAKDREVKAEQDAEKKKKLEAERDALDRQIELKKITQKRLEAEFRHVMAELDALD